MVGLPVGKTREKTNKERDMALEDKVKDIIEDLGADSLDTGELVMAFEEEFGQDIPDEDAEKLTTVGAVVSYMKEKGIEA